MTYLQSLDKALELFIEFKFCESDFYFLNGDKNCMVATYNFGSVYTEVMSRLMNKTTPHFQLLPMSKVDTRLQQHYNLIL